MSDTRTPDEIERDLEQNREGLHQTLVALQETFTPDAIFRSITDNLGRHGGDFGKSVGDAAKGNPLALAVTGIGLGWLIFGRGPSADRIEDGARRTGGGSGSGMFGGRDRDPTSTYAGRKTEYGEDADAHIGARGPVPEGQGPNWYSDDHGPSRGQRMRAGLHNARSDAQRRTSDARRRTGEAAGRVRDRSSGMARRLSEGTESMSEQARERIISARERAIMASEDANRGLREGADRAGDFFEEHPLVVGALAFAVGAAIAGGLPRSRYEDEHFGAESDRLYDEAERIFAEERAKAERVAGAALDEAKSVGQEVRSEAHDKAREAKDKADSETQGEGSAADAAVERAEGAARRVATAAEDQAKKEDLGRSRG